MEEIYDIIKDDDENEKALKGAAKRESLLLGGLIALEDIFESMAGILRQTGHAEIICAKRDEILAASGLEPLGHEGQRLEPRIHTVADAVFSDAPVESIVRILEKGYEYNGKVIRKATVILSKGKTE